ncbi:MAG: radical SAM protein [Bacteroidales bacterium]|nr:radical SAM protein [Bacteroidales bacterium]
MFKKSSLDPEKTDILLQNIKPDLRLLLLFTNQKCNARCNFCHIWGEKGWALNNSGEQSLEEIELSVITKFVNDAIKINKKQFWVMLTGGEPTLYKNFEPLVQFLKNNNLPIILLTNGSRLVKQSKFIVENQINVISISLDGPPLIHDSIRSINGLYNSVCDGIEIIIKEKKRRRSHYPMLFLNCVISDYNSAYMKEFISQLKIQFAERGIKLGFNLESMKEFNEVVMRFEPMLHTTEEQVVKYKEEMKKYFNTELSSTPFSFVHDNSGIEIKSVKNFLESLWGEDGANFNEFVEVDEYFQNIHNTFGHKRCFAPWHGMIVRPNGDVYFCPDFKEYKIGNITQSNFDEIWNGDKANKFREVLKTRLLSLCNRCGGLYTDYNSLDLNC